MIPDRKFNSLNLGSILKLVGKPIFLLLLIFVFIAYFITLSLKKIVGKIKHKTSKKSAAEKTNSYSLKHFIKPLFLINKTISCQLKFVKSFIYYVIQTPKNVLIQIYSARKHIPKLPKIKISYIKLAFLSLLFISSYYSYQLIIKDLPHPKQLLDHKPPVTTKLLDRNNRPLYQIYEDEDRSIISLDQLPDHVILATLAIEDSNFYQHPGFSIKGILRAAKANISKDSLQGGSTITQQLVKNTLLTPERTITRKVKELIVAVAVESYFTKDEILTMYFNQVGYGGTAYGIEAASQLYFDKPARLINLSEAALIAGLPAAPTTYSPYGSYPELSLNRQKEVLRRMVEEGYISPSKANEASQIPLTFASPTRNIHAPHFVMYVRDYLVNLYGEQLVSQGGLNVTTSIDLDIQELAETVVNEELDNLTRLNINNAAVIITKPQTGEILAMVGSRDYFNVENDGQVNVTLRSRQPGSSIKPVNYAYALEHGYSPNTIIEDSPVVYRIAGSKPYAPKNYDGRFHGRVTLRQALANSYNVPAVKTLNHFGVSNMISIGQDLGITTWDNPNRFGLALTLGGGEVTLADMSVVYGTFANSGLKVPLNPLLTITDYTSKNYSIPHCSLPSSQLTLTSQAHAISIQEDCIPKKVISPATAFLMSDILSDNKARSSAFGSNSVLNIPGHQVAVKTGTTNNLRDNWTIGYTSDYVVGVWVGNNDNTPMSYVASGITGASPIWSKIITALLKDQPTHTFNQSSNIVKVDICQATNTLTCVGCPNPKSEYFISGTEPTKKCSPNHFKPRDHQLQDSHRDQILEGTSTNIEQI